MKTLKPFTPFTSLKSIFTFSVLALAMFFTSCEKELETKTQIGPVKETSFTLPSIISAPDGYLITEVTANVYRATDDSLLISVANRDLIEDSINITFNQELVEMLNNGTKLNLRYNIVATKNNGQEIYDATFGSSNVDLSNINVRNGYIIVADLNKNDLILRESGKTIITRIWTPEAYKLTEVEAVMALSSTEEVISVFQDDSIYMVLKINQALLDSYQTEAITFFYKVFLSRNGKTYRGVATVPRVDISKKIEIQVTINEEDLVVI